MASDQTKLITWGWGKYSDMMQKSLGVGLQTTFKTFEDLKFYSPGHLLYFHPALTPCSVTKIPQFYFGGYLFSIFCPCALWVLHNFQKQSVWLKLYQPVHSTLWWLGQGQQGPAWSMGLHEIHFCGVSGIVGEMDSRFLSLVFGGWVDCILELKPGKGSQQPRSQVDRSGERKTLDAYECGLRPYILCPRPALSCTLFKGTIHSLVAMSVWMGLSVRALRTMHIFPVLPLTTEVVHLTIMSFFGDIINTLSLSTYTFGHVSLGGLYIAPAAEMCVLL